MIKGNQYFFGLFAAFALGLVIYLFQPFWLNIIIAALLAVATSNITLLSLRITKNNKTLSAAITTAFLLVLFLAPLLYGIISVGSYAASFDLSKITKTIEYLKTASFHLPESVSFLEPRLKEFIESIDIAALGTKSIASLASLGKLSAKFVMDMGFILVFFFFAVLYGTELVSYLRENLPLKKDNTQFILSEMANVMSVVFYSVLANMIIQGVLFSIITAVYGFNPILTGMLFAICSLVPVVGGLLAFGPISLYLLASGDASGALVVAAYSIIVISFGADTLLKPLVIKFINDKLVKIPTKINELLIFFAMIAGLATFGFWGIILGPAIVTFFISTIKLYTLLRESGVWQDEP